MAMRLLGRGRLSHLNVWGPVNPPVNVPVSAQIGARFSQAIDAELQEGEHLVWSGCQSRHRFVQAFWLKALIPLLWTATALVLMVMTHADLQWLQLSTWTSFHWFAAFMAWLGPVGLLAETYSHWHQPPVVYFITNRRAVALTGKRLRRVHSYWPEQLEYATRTEYADGTGDVQFEKVRVSDGKGEYVVHMHGFYGIQGARKAERCIIELRQGALKTPSGRFKSDAG